MTRRRLYSLVAGVAVLAAISWWRLSEDAPPLPPRPGELPLHDANRSPGEAPGEIAVGSFTGETMGTTYTVRFVPPHPGVEEVLKAAAETALVAVNESMSTYDPKSEVSRINASTLEGSLPISEDLNEVLAMAAQVHEQSEGAFDVTVGPLVSAFGFGPEKDAPPPDDATLARLDRSVGMHLLIVDSEARSLEKLSPETEIDLGGIAKGFGVDKVAEALENLDVESYMVEVGGEIRVKGRKPDDSPWVLAIEEPTPGERRIHGTLSLPDSGAALATSGDYRNFKKIGDRVVSHTFDPRTKRPVKRRTASVSVVRSTAAEADAWATAMTVLPTDRALSIANSRDIPVYLLTHDDRGGFTAHQSESWKTLGMKTR